MRRFTWFYLRSLHSGWCLLPLSWIPEAWAWPASRQAGRACRAHLWATKACCPQKQARSTPHYEQKRGQGLQCVLFNHLVCCSEHDKKISPDFLTSSLWVLRALQTPQALLQRAVTARWCYVCCSCVALKSWLTLRTLFAESLFGERQYFYRSHSFFHISY